MIVILQIFLFFLILLYGFYYYNSRILNGIPSDRIEKDGVYFIFRRPLNFIQFINFWFGFGLGSLKVVIKLSETYLIYDYDSKLRIYCKHETSDRKHQDFLIFTTNKSILIKRIEMNDYLKFMKDLDFYCLDKKWDIFNNNCIWILKTPLENQGIKISLLPGIFFRNVRNFNKVN